MKRTLNMIVGDVVAANKRKQFTAHEIAEIIIKKEREFITRKIERTGKTEKVLLFQLMSEIGAQYPKMARYNVGHSSTRPFKYFYQKAVPTASAKKTVNKK